MPDIPWWSKPVSLGGWKEKIRGTDVCGDTGCSSDSMVQGEVFSVWQKKTWALHVIRTQGSLGENIVVHSPWRHKLGLSVYDVYGFLFRIWRLGCCELSNFKLFWVCCGLRYLNPLVVYMEVMNLIFGCLGSGDAPNPSIGRIHPDCISIGEDSSKKNLKMFESRGLQTRYNQTNLLRGLTITMVINHLLGGSSHDLFEWLICPWWLRRS